uniref:Uncharacterized protein n=1 Tax=Rhodnius prolixus TaxID=13249 RepID=T1I8N7_RHOPR
MATGCVVSRTKVLLVTDINRVVSFTCLTLTGRTHEHTIDPAHGIREVIKVHLRPTAAAAFFQCTSISEQYLVHSLNFWTAVDLLQVKSSLEVRSKENRYPKLVALEVIKRCVYWYRELQNVNNEYGLVYDFKSNSYNEWKKFFVKLRDRIRLTIVETAGIKALPKT